CRWQSSVPHEAPVKMPRVSGPYQSRFPLINQNHPFPASFNRITPGNMGVNPCGIRTLPIGWQTLFCKYESGDGICGLRKATSGEDCDILGRSILFIRPGPGAELEPGIPPPGPPWGETGGQGGNMA